jgi:hypothetical protein
MKNLCDNRHRLGDGGAGAVEEFVSIGENDSSFADSSQLKPSR